MSPELQRVRLLVINPKHRGDTLTSKEGDELEDIAVPDDYGGIPMRAIHDDRVGAAVEVVRLVGRPGEIVPEDGTYCCLCCGASLRRLRRRRRFPDCPTNNCPTIWMWSEP